jgi:hypothetical protein
MRFRIILNKMVSVARPEGHNVRENGLRIILSSVQNRYEMMQRKNDLFCCLHSYSDAPIRKQLFVNPVFLLYLLFSPEDGGNIPFNRWWTFNRLHGGISQETELFL